MAKYYGVIGYVETVETEPGIWSEDKIVEKESYGDLIRNTVRHENSGGVNPNINMANSVSILADPYANENFHKIRYIKFKLPNLGGVWEVSNVEVADPRLILTLGGVYNGVTLSVTK